MDAVPLLLTTAVVVPAPSGSAVLHMTPMEPSPQLQEQHVPAQGGWCTCWPGARRPGGRRQHHHGGAAANANDALASGSSSSFLRKAAMHAGECDLDGEELCPPASLPSGTRPSDPDVNAIVHLYRADVTRLTAYRQRLDTTTNWAVSITGVLVAFSLGSPQTSHYFFGFIVVLQLFFAGVEARRLTYYRLVRHRCRLMERGLYAHMLEPDMPAADWRRALRDAYMETAVLLPFWQAFLIRIKRIYSYLVLATYLGWLFKIVSVVEATGAPMPWPAVAIVSAVVFPITSYAIFVHGEQRLDV